MGTGQNLGTYPPIFHTVDMRHVELIGNFFHNLILYLLFIFVYLLLNSLQEIQEICQHDEYGCQQ